MPPLHPHCCWKVWGLFHSSSVSLMCYSMNHSCFLSSFLSPSFRSFCLTLCPRVTPHALTPHRWLSVGTSSEVLTGHMHEVQVNRRAGCTGRCVCGGRRGSRSKVATIRKSQIQYYPSSCEIVFQKWLLIGSFSFYILCLVSTACFFSNVQKRRFETAVADLNSAFKSVQGHIKRPPTDQS